MKITNNKLLTCLLIVFISFSMIVNVVFSNISIAEEINTEIQQNEEEQTDENSIQEDNKKIEEIDTNLGKIIVETDQLTAINTGDKIKIKISTEAQNVISVFFQIRYNNKTFEKINFETDIKVHDGWQVIPLDENEVILLTDNEELAISNDWLAEIELTAKKDTTIYSINLNNIVISNTDYEDSLNEEGYGYNSVIRIPEHQGDELYLSTSIYKIGNNDIRNYDPEDIIISRVIAGTQLTDFTDELYTNGTIKVIKQNGEELGPDELVGTGMTLEVTKDDETISLQIAVMGDLDGDGIITAADLSAEGQLVLETLSLEDEYIVAADIDEDSEITATDLSAENQCVLELITIEYD